MKSPTYVAAKASGDHSEGEPNIKSAVNRIKLKVSDEEIVSETKNVKLDDKKESFKAFLKSEIFSVKLKERFENGKQRHLSLNFENTESAETNSAIEEAISLENRTNLDEFSDMNRPKIGQVVSEDYLDEKGGPQVSFFILLAKMIQS